MTYTAPPYADIHTFLNAPLSGGTWTNAGFLGIPYDRGVSNRPGARFAPNAIRAASKMLCESVPNLIDLGDVNLAAPTDEEMFERITQMVSIMLRDGMYPVCVGGDHTITLPILRAMARVHGRVRLVHFDAHPDTWPDNWGIKYGHGSFVRHALDEGLIDGAASYQIGIRCPMTEDIWDYTCGSIGHVITAGDIVEERVTLEEILGGLVQSDAPTYLTLDIDCLDPSQAPGTGTPEIAGLSTHWLKRFIGSPAMKKINWVGMDVTEVNPIYDQSEITALAAATFIYLHLMTK